MKRNLLSFLTFKQAYIDHPVGGYLPVYVSLHESETNYKAVELDMIYHLRLPDGKVQFLLVEFETRQEFDEIMIYCYNCVPSLAASIAKTINTTIKAAHLVL